MNMEATFKIILDRVHPKKDLTLPLRLRIYQGRKYREQSLGISIPENDWNELKQEVKSSNASYKVFNSKISTVKAKVQRAILLNDDDETNMSADELIAKVGKKKKVKAEQPKPDVFLYAKAHIEALEKSGRIGNSIVYTCAVNKLKEYASKEKLTFTEIDYSFLQAYNTRLLTDGLKVNAVSNYMRTLRALFNKAINEEIIPETCYPFRKFKIKSEKTINRSLTVSEIGSIVHLDLIPDSKIWHYRNLFMLSYTLIGANFADLLTLKQENIVDDRIVFRRKKTHKVYSILIQPEAKEILTEYTKGVKHNNEQFLLPFIVNKHNPIALKKDILQAIKNTNDYLAKMAKQCNINKPVTTYYARYTWANTARGLGYSKDLIAEALGHEYGNKVTGIYLDNYSNKIIDEMNARVIEHSFSAITK